MTRKATADPRPTPIRISGSADGTVVRKHPPRMPAREHLAQDDAERVQVRTAVDVCPSEQLFGRHVGRRAGQRAAAGQPCSPHGVRPGDPEVDKLHAAGGRPDDVLRLEVAMDDAGRVRRGERLGDGDCNRARPLDRDRPAHDLHAQRFALDVRRDDEQLAAGLFEGEDRRDTRMRDRRRRTRFARQPLAQLRRGAGRRGQRLDGDPPAEPRILGEVDNPRPTAPDLLDDPVGSDGRARGKPLHQVREVDRRGLLEEAAGRVVCGDERFDLAEQVGIAGAGASQEGAAGIHRLFDRVGEDRLYPLPARREHDCRHASSSFFSQARASAQCRLTVAGEDPITSAVSFTVSPPKYRSSTTRPGRDRAAQGATTPRRARSRRCRRGAKRVPQVGGRH